MLISTHFELWGSEKRIYFLHLWKCWNFWIPYQIYLNSCHYSEQLTLFCLFAHSICHFPVNITETHPLLLGVPIWIAQLGAHLHKLVGNGFYKKIKGKLLGYKLTFFYCVQYNFSNIHMHYTGWQWVLSGLQAINKLYMPFLIQMYRSCLAIIRYILNIY